MKFLNSRFTKNVLLLVGGTTFAQLFNTIVTPIITRLYHPEEYGVLTFYITLISLLTIISSLKYEYGIAISSNDNKAINILVLSICVLLFFVCCISPVFFVLSKIYEILKFWYLIPIGILFAGLYNIFLQWALRKRDFKSISKTKIIQSVFSNITKIGLGFLKIGPIGLILGNIIGVSAGIRALSLTLFNQKKLFYKSISKKRLYWGLQRYIKFPIYFTPSQLLNHLGVQLPIFFLTFLFGSKLVGYYSLAHTIVNLPTLLLGNSIGDVFYSEAVNIGKSNPKKLKHLSIKLFKKLLFTGIIPFIIVVLFGPGLFSLVFGSNWYEAGIFAQILAFLVYARLIFMPTSRVFEVFEKQKQVFWLDLTRVVLVLIVFLVSIYFVFDVYLTLILYCIAMILIYFVTFVYAQVLINEYINK